jgi:CRISPR-associated protein Cmr4
MSNNSNNHTQSSALMLVHALTSVHAGTGQSVAVIDLPIAREKATGFPTVPGSSVKGVLRDRLSRSDTKWTDMVFGVQERSGALCVTDLRILCLPVRSLYGTFAYVTSPIVLWRLSRDCDAMGIEAFAKLLKLDLPMAGDHLDARVPSASGEVISPNAATGKANMFLEDLDLHAAQDDVAGAAAAVLASVLFAGNEADFTGRFVVVPDTVFSFLCETATEVAARVSLEATTKTVRTGGLWFEEAVPAETIFYGLATVENRFLGDALPDPIEALQSVSAVQLGGDTSVGRGLCRLVVVK